MQYSLLHVLLTFSCTLAWPWPGITLPGLQEKGVQVTPCCSKGEHLVLKELRRGGRKAECVQGVDNELEPKVWTTDGLRQLELLEAHTPRCSRGLRLAGIRQNNTQQVVPRFGNDTIILRGGSTSNEGNVYINGSPVCDDSWDDTDARVVCRMLGYSGARATQGSIFGSVPGGVYGMDEVQCRGDEDSLVDCPHDTTDDCTASEAAGVVCGSTVGLGDTVANLSPEGELQFGAEIPSGTINGTEVDQSAVPLSALEQGEFCLSPGFRETSREREEEGLVGLYCDVCKEQVLCTYAEELFDILAWGDKKHIVEQCPPTSSVVAVADTNEDAKVDFDEFHMKLKEYLQTAFDALDESKDGSLYDEAKGGKLFNKISFKLLNAALDQVLIFFDANNDKFVGLDDSFFSNVGRYRKPLLDDKKTLSDVFGTSLISLPAPLYNIYTSLDSNRDEKLADTEAQDFLLRLFSTIDTDSDCHISADEMVALLQRVGVRPDHQLAVRMILGQYLALGSYLLQAFVQEADVDRDTRVTMEEVVTFSNFEFMEEQIQVVLSLGQQQHRGGAFSYLFSEGQYRDRERSEETVAMWLTALQNLLELPEFSKMVDPETLAQC